MMWPSSLATDVKRAPRSGFARAFYWTEKNYLHGLFLYQSLNWSWWLSLSLHLSPSLFVVNTIIINVVDEILISFVKIISDNQLICLFVVVVKEHKHSKHSKLVHKNREERKKWIKKKKNGYIDIETHTDGERILISYLWLKTRFYNRTNSFWRERKKEANCLS